VTELPRLWHVTLTVAGHAHDATIVRAALERLGGERPFMHSLRYRSSRAELQYWEEASGMLDAASLALRLWWEHRDSCGLPDWEVVGLEVLERDTLQQRPAPHAPSGVGLPNATPRPY
jgi:hypothetical protein